MKKTKLQKDQSPYMGFKVVVIVWLTLLTIFTIWSFSALRWQVQQDINSTGDNIGRLLIENSQQQRSIDKLNKKINSD